jgi:hypothetical protein
MRIRVLLVAACLMLCTLMARPAQATPVLGAQLYATGGNVIATFLGHEASYTNQLFLFMFDPNNIPHAISGVIFNNKTSPVGTSVNLGSFAANTELVFGIKVLNTGHTFYTGAGSRNPDGIAHATVDFDMSPAVVGFEDLYGGGDRDYNDLVFSFSNVQHERVPEPSSLLLLGSGLVGVALSRARRRTSRAR